MWKTWIKCVERTGKQLMSQYLLYHPWPKSSTGQPPPLLLTYAPQSALFQFSTNPEAGGSKVIYSAAQKKLSGTWEFSFIPFWHPQHVGSCDQAFSSRLQGGCKVPARALSITSSQMHIKSKNKKNKKRERDKSLPLSHFKLRKKFPESFQQLSHYMLLGSVSCLKR